MRHIPKERQAACQTDQELLDALKPPTSNAQMQTNHLPQLQAQALPAQQQEEQPRRHQEARPRVSEATSGFSELSLATGHRPHTRSRAWALKCVVQVRHGLLAGLLLLMARPPPASTALHPRPCCRYTATRRRRTRRTTGRAPRALPSASLCTAGTCTGGLGVGAGGAPAGVQSDVLLLVDAGRFCLQRGSPP